MAKPLKLILKHVNPLRDFEDADFYKNIVPPKDYDPKTATIEETQEIHKKIKLAKRKHAFGHAKPVIRSGLLSIIFGYGATLFNPDLDANLNTLVTFNYIFPIDFLQYGARAFVRYYKAVKDFYIKK